MIKYYFTVSTILALTVIIPLITGLVRFNRLNGDFFPLVGICGLGFFVELARFIMLLNRNISLAPYNLFVLGNFLLFMVLFKRWGVFHKRYMVFVVLVVVMILFWVADMFFINGYMFNDAPVNYRLCYSALLCLIAAIMVNKLTVNEKGSLIRNPKFWVCSCVLVYFSINIIIESFSLPNIKIGSMGYEISKFGIRSLLNPIIYLVYTLVFLWAPTKKNFLQLS
jgi:hypothetical protein